MWNVPLTLGKYDVAVDVNSNGIHDEGVDAIDNNDVEVTAGFTIPEFSLLLVLSLVMMITLLATLIYRKKRYAIHK